MKGNVMDSRKHRAIIYCLCVCMYIECVYFGMCVTDREKEIDDSSVCLAPL